MWLFPLQSVLRKVNPQDALQIAPLMMQALLQMLNPSSGAKIVGGVQEDALMAIGTLVESMSMNEKKWIINIGNWIERSPNLIGIMRWVSLQHKFDLKSQVSITTNHKKFNFHLFTSILKLQNSVPQIQVFLVGTNILLI